MRGPGRACLWGTSRWPRELRAQREAPGPSVRPAKWRRNTGDQCRSTNASTPQARAGRCVCGGTVNDGRSGNPSGGSKGPGRSPRPLGRLPPSPHGPRGPPFAPMSTGTTDSRGGEIRQMKTLPPVTCHRAVDLTPPRLVSDCVGQGVMGWLLWWPFPARSCSALVTSGKWLNAWRLLPSCRRDCGSHSSLSRPTSLPMARSRSNRSVASAVCPARCSASTSQNEQARKRPSPPVSPSSESVVSYHFDERSPGRPEAPKLFSRTDQAL